jgi:hypothetical protein
MSGGLATQAARHSGIDVITACHRFGPLAAQVEINPLSKRPMALGHSGAEVAAFGIKVRA